MAGRPTRCGTGDEATVSGAQGQGGPRAPVANRNWPLAGGCSGGRSPLRSVAVTADEGQDCERSRRPPAEYVGGGGLSD